MRVYDLMPLIPLLPLAAFAVMFGLTYDNKRLSAWIGILAATASGVISIALLATELAKPEHVEHAFDFITAGSFTTQFGVLADPLSSMMVVVVCGVSALIQFYSLEYMRGEEGFVRYYALISLFTFSMLGLVLSTNYFQTYVFWELVGVCSYFLIGHYFKRPSAAAAAKKAFIVTRFGDFPFLVGIGYIFFRFGDLNFYHLAPLYAAGKVGVFGLFILAMLVFSGAVGKSAQFPLHVWLPDAMEGPTPISALIHAATMVAAGVYLVARAYNLFSASPPALTVITIIGALTSLMAAIWAVAQDDIKRIVAYSTISHLGLMMFGLGVGAYSAAVFHLFTHAWFKALLFLGAGSVIHVLHTQDIWEMGGLWRRMRITSATMLIGCAAAAGIPPFSGFWSKDGIVAGVFAKGNPVFILAALLITFFSALYIFRLFFVVFGGEPARRRAFDAKRIHESNIVIGIPLLVLGVLATISGLWSSLLSKSGFSDFIFFGRHPVAETADLTVLAISVFVAGAGVLVAALFYLEGFRRFSAAALNARLAPVYAWSHNKGYFDEAYQVVFVRGVLLRAGAIVQWIDRVIIDGFVDGLAAAYGVAGDLLRRLQTGRVQSYAVGLFAGVVVLTVVLLILQSNSPLAAIH